MQWVTNNSFFNVWLGMSLILTWVSYACAVLQLQQEYITVAYLNIYTSLHLRPMGVHSPLQHCIAEDSPGIPPLCAEHRYIRDVSIPCPAASASQRAQPFICVLWGQTQVLHQTQKQDVASARTPQNTREQNAAVWLCKKIYLDLHKCVY